MIETDVIEIERCPAQPIDPPGIAPFFHHVPAIERIAPALAFLAEEIRRHSSNDLGLKFRIEAEKIRMSPDVGAVEVDKDSEIACHANGTLRAVATQRPPLFVEKKLDDPADIEFIAHFLARFLKSCGIAVNQIAGPAIPGLKVEVGTQRVKENKIVEPPLVLAHETVVARARGTRSQSKKFVGRLEKQR